MSHLSTLHPIYRMISDYFTQNIPDQFDSFVDRNGLHIRSTPEKWICHFLISSNKASISVESHSTRFCRSFILRHPTGYNDSQYYLEVAQQLSLFAMPYIQHKSYPSSFYSRPESIQNKSSSLSDAIDIDSFCKELGHNLNYDLTASARWLFINGDSVRLSGEPGDLYLKFNDDSIDYTFDSDTQSVDGTISITTYSDTLKRLSEILDPLINYT